MEELLIPKIEVDGSRKPHIVRYMLNKKLKSVIDARQSIFERVYPIGEKLATKMLSLGYKQPSRFGRWCPVRVNRGLLNAFCLRLTLNSKIRLAFILYNMYSYDGVYMFSLHKTSVLNFFF